MWSTLRLRYHLQAGIWQHQLAIQRSHFAKRAQDEGSESGSKLAKFATEVRHLTHAALKAQDQTNLYFQHFKDIFGTSKVMSPAPVEAHVRTPEELADAERRVKEYSRRCMRKERLWQMDLMEKIKLRDAAVAALPEQFCEEALYFNRETFPIERLMFTDTPPKKGGEQIKVKKIRRIGTKKD